MIETNVGGKKLNFQSYKRWMSIGLLVAACAIVPQTVKADTVIESDGVMGQSITDEMQSDPAEDYVWLSAGMEAPAAFDVDAMPLLGQAAIRTCSWRVHLQRSVILTAVLIIIIIHMQIMSLLMVSMYPGGRAEAEVAQRVK